MGWERPSRPRVDTRGCGPHGLEDHDCAVCRCRGCGALPQALPRPRVA